MYSKRQFHGLPTTLPVIFQKAQLVCAPERGISFERPDRFIVNTPVGQVEIVPGDWVVEYVVGRPYVIRQCDISNEQYATMPKRKWWQIWK